MQVDDLAPLLQFIPRFGGTVDRQGDLGFHQGVITSWNASTGENVISVAGGTVTNIPVMSTADSIMLAAGDVVGLLRFKSTYFILGRIGPPGAGAALGIRAATVSTFDSTTSTSFGDLPNSAGPTLTDVYIGSSRRCLVLLSVGAFTGDPSASSTASAHFAVSGASTIAPPSNINKGAFIRGVFGSTHPGASATRMFLLTASDGLNAGMNTFTVKYRSENSVQVSFQDRTIVVFPF